jgi:hypothetical protein
MADEQNPQLEAICGRERAGVPGTRGFRVLGWEAGARS